MYFTTEDEKEEIASHVDKYSDSYARDTTPAELKEVSVLEPIPCGSSF